ncbi:hydroxymethylpyrimidine/phosphomethylpyrimidine kinase [Massilia sp. Root351]|nr:hydroxymethylpyrimidine/phosphomethylpyrimidine kinase [Massilia sp. Root351]
MTARPARPRCVLVFSGADPSGGAGIAADILAIHAQGAHALPVITALTVQDNDRVHEVLPVAPDVVSRQARALLAKGEVDAVKIGIPGSAANAAAIAQVIAQLRRTSPELPVVLDPVLASGHGDLLSRGDAVQALAVLLPLVTLITPNGPEAAALAAGYGSAGPGDDAIARGAARALLDQGCRHVLVTGGHGAGDTVINRWFSAATEPAPSSGHGWSWARLPGEFHGSGCTLAAAIAALLAHGYPMQQALARAQGYTHRALAAAFAIAPGQRIPQR